MTKNALLRKLEVVMNEAERSRMYGHIEIEFKNGEPVFMRTTHQEKLDETENRPNGRQTYR